jgi:thiol-disulfide isomerase/thioredoxin
MARPPHRLPIAALLAVALLACREEPKAPAAPPAPPSPSAGIAPAPSHAPMGAPAPTVGDPEPRGPVVGPGDFLWARDAVAPPIDLPTLGGPRFSLAAEKGKVVFVNFWATWCPPCRDEMPTMLELGRRLEARYPKKFRMVAVSADRDPDAARHFFAAAPYSGSTQGVMVALDPSNAATQAYFCAGRGACPPGFAFPETYIVKDGKIVSFLWGPRNWSNPEVVAYLEKLINS